MKPLTRYFGPLSSVPSDSRLSKFEVDSCHPPQGRGPGVFVRDLQPRTPKTSSSPDVPGTARVSSRFGAGETSDHQNKEGTSRHTYSVFRTQSVHTIMWTLAHFRFVTGDFPSSPCLFVPPNDTTLGVADASPSVPEDDDLRGLRVV